MHVYLEVNGLYLKVNGAMASPHQRTVKSSYLKHIRFNDLLGFYPTLRTVVKANNVENQCQRSFTSVFETYLNNFEFVNSEQEI